MTPEEIEVAKIAEEARVATLIASDPLTKAQEEIARVIEERDNYKNVALKRLGKLPGDASFLGNDELSVEEQVRIALLDREIAKNKEAEALETKRILRENSELKLALKNQPGKSLGGGSSSAGVEVKDNVFSEAQLAELTARAIRLKADPVKFIENMKANLSR